MSIKTLKHQNMKAVKWLKDFVLDTVFPIVCLKCAKEGEWLCKECVNSISIEAEDQCLVCKTVSVSGRTCFLCQKECTLKRVLRFVNYSEPHIQATLRVMKYGFVPDALNSILDMLAPHARLKFDCLDIDPRALVFVPVPLHPWRFRERGFNQSTIIASAFARVTGGAVVQALKRLHYRPPQVFLDAFDRARNIRGNFACVNPAAARGQYVCLVDDVATTGATLNECGKALLTAEPKEIWAVVLASG